MCVSYSLLPSSRFKLLSLMSMNEFLRRNTFEKKERESWNRHVRIFAAPARKSVRETRPCIDKHKSRLSDQSGAGDRRLRRFRVKSRSLCFRFVCPYKPDSEKTGSSRRIRARILSRISDVSVTVKVAPAPRRGSQLIRETDEPIRGLKSLRIDACVTADKIWTKLGLSVLSLFALH